MKETLIYLLVAAIGPMVVLVLMKSHAPSWEGAARRRPWLLLVSIIASAILALVVLRLIMTISDIIPTSIQFHHSDGV